MNHSPTFNIWSEPWLTVERADGSLAEISIEMLLREAHTLRRLFDPSPLVVVGVQRLLIAIVQDIVQPESSGDLAQLWRVGRFDEAAIARFGEAYADRFDLFSEDAPFLQSADLPRVPPKRAKTKPVGYLFQEQPAGTAVTHYRHDYDDEMIFCARCTAKGLITLSAFASSGGAGIKPSINGVPPIYVLPGGETLFEQLAASLLTPRLQPAVADRENDTPWWRHDPVVGKKVEVLRVGYLHSLTFPARRVRLHPQPMRESCTRCGEHTVWGVATMVYEMGESRPKDAPLWQDPFAAYRLDSKGKKPPIPVRPVEGRALWREYANLFTPVKFNEDDKRHLRPRVIDQLEHQTLQSTLPFEEYLPFKTVGLRTDMKMKIFEWEESEFDLPATLLDDPDAGYAIEQAIEFAKQVDDKMKYVFRKHFGGSTRGEELNAAVKQRLSQSYWEGLEPQFRQWVLRFGDESDPEALVREWAQDVVRHAQGEFKQAIGRLDSSGGTLRQRVEAENHCRAALYKHLTK